MDWDGEKLAMSLFQEDMRLKFQEDLGYKQRADLNIDWENATPAAKEDHMLSIKERSDWKRQGVKKWKEQIQEWKDNGIIRKNEQ